MSSGSEFLREQFVFCLDVARKRWRLFVGPILVACVLSAVAIKLAPTKYTSSSLIMLQAANRAPGGAGGAPYVNTFEQVKAAEAWLKSQVEAIETWLKSDQVLAELLPQMTGYKPPETQAAKIVQMRRLAASVSLEVVNNSVLEIKMIGASPTDLGRDLEIVIARLLEGLTGPERSIFSAPQFVQIKRTEEAAAAEAELMRAIEAEGFQAPLQIRAELHQLWTLKRNSRGGSASTILQTDKQVSGLSAQAAETAERLRQLIGATPAKVAELERLYAAYQDAADRQAASKMQPVPSRSNYVSIFSSPDDLLVIGRPKDPIAGESAARKYAIAGVLLSVLLGCGLVVVAELMGGVLRMRRQYEEASGLPVVARIARIPGLSRPGRAL